MADGMVGWMKATAHGESHSMVQYAMAAINAAAGMVMIQAQMILRVTPHLTAVTRRVAPTPMIAPVIVWVVLTGIPPQAAPMRLMAPAVSALKPPTGRSAVIRWPIVRTIRQPPESVPRPMAAWAIKITQNGISKVLI